MHSPTGSNCGTGLEGNTHNPFHAVLTGMRARCVAEARALPVVPNPGIGGGRPATASAR